MAKRQKLPLKPRKPVTWCCLPYTLTPPAKRWYVYSKWESPAGCYHGFYGRTALFEVLPITPVIRQLISANTDVESLETHARQAGMRTLFENGCLAVEQGLTTFEELIRVLGMPHGE